MLLLAVSLLGVRLMVLVPATFRDCWLRMRGRCRVGAFLTVTIVVFAVRLGLSD